MVLTAVTLPASYANTMGQLWNLRLKYADLVQVMTTNGQFNE